VSEQVDQERLADRVRHAIVFSEATVRALREALELLERETAVEAGRHPATQT
jgi:hypothetical protein